MSRGLLACLFIAFLVGVPATAQPADATPRHCEDHRLPDDFDCDMVVDAEDNCGTVANPEQINTDRNFTPSEPPAPEEPGAVMVAGDDGSPGERNGDECDEDDDADGIPDVSDNCRTARNPSQKRTQDPVAGDACVTDRDGDGVVDGRDNCSAAANPGQENLDGDSLGDVCDLDDDGDGRNDTADNCPVVANDTQGDADNDGKGTACDPGEAADASAPSDAGPAAGDPPSGDFTLPTVTLFRTTTWTAGDLRGRAPFAVRCSEACGISARLTVRGRLLATGSALLGSRGRTYVFLTPRKGAVARVSRLRRPALATLTLRVVDGAGNRRTVTRRVKLRR